MNNNDGGNGDGNDDSLNNAEVDETLIEHVLNQDDTAGFIMRIDINIDNVSYWAYMMVPADKYDAFIEAQASSFCNIKEYGTIIDCGEGSNPPPQILERMKQEYGVIPDLRNKLSDMTNALEDRFQQTAQEDK